MLVVGIVCIVLGFLLAIPVLYVLGIVLAVIGAVLFVLSFVGPAENRGRRYY